MTRKYTKLNRDHKEMLANIYMCVCVCVCYICMHVYIALLVTDQTIAVVTLTGSLQHETQKCRYVCISYGVCICAKPHARKMMHTYIYFLISVYIPTTTYLHIYVYY